MKRTLCLCFIIMPVLFNTAYGALDESSNLKSAGRVILSDAEQSRVEAVFGQVPDSKEQSCTDDMNCCSVSYFDKDGNLIGSSEGCRNSNPQDPFEFKPNVKYYDKEGNLLDDTTWQREEN